MTIEKFPKVRSISLLRSAVDSWVLLLHSVTFGIVSSSAPAGRMTPHTVTVRRKGLRLSMMRSDPTTVIVEVRICTANCEAMVLNIAESEVTWDITTPGLRRRISVGPRPRAARMTDVRDTATAFSVPRRVSREPT